MDFKTCKLKYEKGDYYKAQGVSGSNAGRVSYSNGYRIKNDGFGWATCSKPSRLVLCVWNDLAGQQEIWVDKFFKDNIGRLTKNRRMVIEETMPDYIVAYAQEKVDGSIYYILDEAYLEEWLERVKLRL